MPYMKMMCKAGRTKEMAKFYTYWLQPKGRKRSKRVNPTTEQQQKINDRHLVRRLTRLLNANFDSSCWYITFDYKKEQRPESVEALQSILLNTSRRPGTQTNRFRRSPITQARTS